MNERIEDACALKRKKTIESPPSRDTHSVSRAASSDEIDGDDALGEDDVGNVVSVDDESAVGNLYGHRGRAHGGIFG